MAKFDRAYQPYIETVELPGATILKAPDAAELREYLEVSVTLSLDDYPHIVFQDHRHVVRFAFRLTDQGIGALRQALAKLD